MEKVDSICFVDWSGVWSLEFELDWGRFIRTILGFLTRWTFNVTSILPLDGFFIPEEGRGEWKGKGRERVTIRLHS